MASSIKKELLNGLFKPSPLEGEGRVRGSKIITLP
jgi:hypothetical protein